MVKKYKIKWGLNKSNMTISNRPKEIVLFDIPEEYRKEAKIKRKWF